jgi:glyceraldehyde-3-phosphate dehydrogenase (NADP+)
LVYIGVVYKDKQKAKKKQPEYLSLTTLNFRTMKSAEPVYCGGEFIHTPTTLEVINPCDRSVVGSCCVASQKELETAILKGISLQVTLHDLPLYERSSALKQIAAAIELRKNELARILSLEACKPLRYALVEVDRAMQVFSIAAEECKRLPSEYIRLDWAPHGKGREGLVKYFPVGLVAGISPFNFPLMLVAHKIAPAIAAGCPIILKPSSSTPLSALALARIIDETNLPKGSVSIMPMDRATGNLLVTDERFKLLTFTGSPEVGWKMKSDAGKKRVVLELGGNAGVIVTAGCDLELAVAKCIAGGFSYAGQVCIHTQRIYVERSIFEKFTELFVEGVKKLRKGSPLDADTDISAMIDEANAIRVEQWVKDAIGAGATLLHGGQRSGAFYEPTVLTNTDFSMNVCFREIFGPVVTIEAFDEFRQAVEWVNKSEYGLQAGVFTNRIDQMDIAFNTLEVGGVMINEIPTYRLDHMPYGGVKNSGMGREGVKYAMMDMMEPRLMVK